MTRKRYIRIANDLLGGAIIALPPYGDEILGLSILGVNRMDDSQVANRDSRNPRHPAQNDQSVQNAVIVINVLAIAAILLIAGVGFRGYIAN